MRILTAVLAFLLASQPAAAKTYRDRTVPMNAVESFDLSRYLGTWYEIARFPNSFERNCAGVTAEYALRDDGKVRVLNTCHDRTPDGPARTALGQATVKGTGMLSVTFVPWLPFAAGKYWVLYVSPDYSLAVVGEPAGKTGWILARGKTVTVSEMETARGVLAANGYDVEQLYYVAQ